MDNSSQVRANRSLAAHLAPSADATEVHNADDGEVFGVRLLATASTLAVVLRPVKY